MPELKLLDESRKTDSHIQLARVAPSHSSASEDGCNRSRFSPHFRRIAVVSDIPDASPHCLSLSASLRSLRESDTTEHFSAIFRRIVFPRSGRRPVLTSSVMFHRLTASMAGLWIQRIASHDSPFRDTLRASAA
jgi:hypothetical protein